MKKILINLSILTIFLITLIGCSNEVAKEFDLNQLTRVDVQLLASDKTLMAEEEIKTLRELFARIEWEHNVKAEMARKEDVKTTFFFTFDKNMPERLFEFYILFNQDSTATIINRDKSALGTLNQEDAQTLQDILENN